MRSATDITRTLAAAAVLSAGLATGALAQFIDLNVNDPGSAACVPSANHVESFDAGTAINETILALTDPAGSNVFWELSFNPGAPSTVSCTPTPAVGFATSYACDNGVSIALPAGATEVASVSSAQPVVVTAPAGTSTEGAVQFVLTATLDGGLFPSCQNFYQLDVLEPKQPFDLMFVLDKSGSMTLPSATGDRWAALSTGVQAFLPFIQAAAELPTPAGSRVGVTFFDTAIGGTSTGMFDVLSGPGAPSANFSNIPSLLSLTPSGWTAMGLGLQTGISEANAAGHNKVVVLFSDGDQNRDPRIALDGCNYTNPAGPINPTCPGQVSHHKICTIGVGNPSPSYASTLESLADNNRCTYLATGNGSDFSGVSAVPGDIGATFQNSIGAALADNSPQQIANFSGLVEPSTGTPNTLDSFHVNRGAEAVSLSFAYSQRFETPQLAELFGAMQITVDGQDVTGQFRPVLFGNFSDVLTLVRDAQPPTGGTARDLAGEYQVTMMRPNESFKPNLEFRLFAYAEERRLHAVASVDETVPKVNDPIQIEVQVDWLNQPIEDAQVVVRAFVPGADMGDLLSEGEAVDLTEGDDAGSPGVQKYDQLAASDPGFLAALALSPDAVPMTHQGAGRYTGAFTLPDTVGMVHLVYDVGAENAALFGRVQRRWYQTVYARFDEVDMENSELTAAWVDDGLLLGARFRRPGAQLLGPGYLDAVQIAGAEVITSRDLQNGSYEFLLDVADADQEIDISMLGETIYSGPAGWGDGPRMTIDRWLKSLPWWLVLMILLLLAFLFWLWRRMSGTSAP